MKYFLSCAKKFLRRQRGAVSLMFLGSFGVLMGSSLFAIDMVRHNVTQTRLQTALDTTVISAGRKLGDLEFTPTGGRVTQKWLDDACNYFHANMPRGFMGSDVRCEDLDINYFESNDEHGRAQHVSMSARGSLPLLSTAYFKQAGWSVNASNQAVRRTRRDLEVVMALDNSGSMTASSRMVKLKESANMLIDTVLDAAELNIDDSEEVRGAYIGLVPFTETVNMQNIAAARAWLAHEPAMQNYMNNLWDGCVTEPWGNWSNSTPLPAQAMTPNAGFMPMRQVYSNYYTPNLATLANNHAKNLPSGTRVKSNSTKLLATGFAFNQPSGSNWQSLDRRMAASLDLNNNRIQVNLALENRRCLSSKVRFLSKEKSLLKSAVNGMVADGGTNIPMGLLWGWRMLSPQWRGTGWGDARMPRDLEDNKLKKVMVLLSDGDNSLTPLQFIAQMKNYSSKAGNTAFGLSYQYQYDLETCTGSGKKEKCTTTTTKTASQSENLTWALSVDKKNNLYDTGVFIQCPGTGLIQKRVTDVTPSNYDSACSSSNTNFGYGVSNSSANGYGFATASIDAFMTEVCTNMKREGIQIYTVTLGTDVSSAGKAAMRGCASSADKYYDVLNSNDLIDAFGGIAGALTELRLEK